MAQNLVEICSLVGKYLGLKIKLTIHFIDQQHKKLERGYETRFSRKVTMNLKGSRPEMKLFVQTLTQNLSHIGHLIQKRLVAWTKPAGSSLVVGAVGNHSKSKAD